MKAPAFPAKFRGAPGPARRLDLGPGLRREEREGRALFYAIPTGATSMNDLPPFPALPGKGERERGRALFYTYMMASGRNGTLYTGSTDDLRNRVHQHRMHDRTSFCGRYGVHTLVWFEGYETRDAAFRRERRIKEWRRAWKLRLIEERNPDWRDLYDDLNDLLPY